MAGFDDLAASLCIDFSNNCQDAVYDYYIWKQHRRESQVDILHGVNEPDIDNDNSVVPSSPTSKELC